MRSLSLHLLGAGLACAAWLAGGPSACAAGTNAEAEASILTNGTDEAGSAPDTNAAPEVAEGATNESGTIEEKAPAKVAPTYRGSDMCNAFGGAGSSRFGVSGRVNPIARKEGKPKTDGAWRRDIELGVSTSRGNSDTLRFDGSLSGFKETAENTFFLKAAGRYGESDEEKDTENATGEGKVQHRLSERMYVAMDGNVFHDPMADLSYRAQGSLSLGRHFIRAGRTALSAEIGPGYVVEKKGGGIEGFMAGRGAQYLEFLITPTLQIWEAAEFVSDLEDSAVYFMNVKIGLDTALLADWSLRFTIEDRYDSQPAEDKESNDLLTTTSLVWKF